jgi:hypothetical protein
MVKRILILLAGLFVFGGCQESELGDLFVARRAEKKAAYERRRKQAYPVKSYSGVENKAAVKQGGSQDYPVRSYSYDEYSRKGSISVDISGHGIEARESVIENIGKICSDKGIILKYGEEVREGAAYRVLSESVRDGVLTVEFEFVR